MTIESGNLTKITTPLGITNEFSCDFRNNVISQTGGNGNVTGFTYDKNGRRTTRTTVDGNTTYTYDSNDNLFTVTNENGTISRTYDSLNRVISYTNTNGDTIGYENDSNSNLTKLTYPDGKAVNYSYNANNQSINFRYGLE